MQRGWLALGSLVVASPAAAETYEPAGRIEVTCTQPGVRVLLDGIPWFACPGSQSRVASPGEHEVHGEGTGYLPATQRLLVSENGAARTDVQLRPLDRPIVVEHRFPTWLPWTLIGTGATGSLAGVLVRRHGNQLMDDYERQVAMQCAVTGCTAEQLETLGLTDLRERAESRKTLGSAVALGGLAVIATGIVLQLVNRPVRQVNVAVLPAAGGATAHASWQF